MATRVRPTDKSVDRPTAVRSVLASFRMEGLEPDAKTAALLDQYAAGSLSLEQLGSAIERHAARIKAEKSARNAA